MSNFSELVLHRGRVSHPCNTRALEGGSKGPCLDTHSCHLQNRIDNRSRLVIPRLYQALSVFSHLKIGEVPSSQDSVEPAKRLQADHAERHEQPVGETTDPAALKRLMKH